ncbi:MetQ/NlpA family ABC transporter substrate-binding protein [Cellulomonas shaoxiangyii]|uniref:Lipoprotein n=1 Tax=Cellulomonas shaoxiangyii TaxID=2566013 RepID=A0A4P7SFT4_9CELL|nr:MetQ/NlpA family ABC transporter substrate-binding protein [Cellulomonas shaoxiangyii]QCB92428.1 ABC transporter substrate-binding protein [Cellulomonas shaoxiangyii]TGY85631.1 ABC transporter substrate-binding protein [Cellulomonas shaoxiangyii]
MKRTLRTAAVLSAAALVMAGCSGGGDVEPDGRATAEDGATVLVVGASPVPHAEILQFVQDELAADAGIELQIREFTDYVLPNTALAEGELDANYFQHVPYLEAQVEEQGFDFDHFEGVHIEPYGLYSESVESVEDIPVGGTIAITNDPGNQSRALDLLVEAGLITLAETDGDATLLDVEENPKDLELIETAPEQLVVSLQDVDAAVVNGNFALEAGLSPAEDAILLESGVDNPYANVLAVRSQDAQDEALVTLDELLHSDEVKAFIEERWPSGEVLPAF